jgi:hypothetical protein
VPPVRRIAAIFSTILAWVAIMAIAASPVVAAMKAPGGEGAYGKTDDVVVTNFGFGLMVFFVLFVTVLSVGQWLLARRKH